MEILHPRYQFCFGCVDNLIDFCKILVRSSIPGFAIGAIFVREVFHQDSKIQAEEMINNVRNAFKNNFKNLKWMDDDTRKLAIAKADAISDMIGAITLYIFLDIFNMIIIFRIS